MNNQKIKKNIWEFNENKEIKIIDNFKAYFILIFNEINWIYYLFFF